jgi:cob(I)alamin adenosyltransferase
MATPTDQQQIRATLRRAERNMGAAEAADVLGMKATNLKRLSPPLPVAAVISGRIPVYREADVMAAKARRDARRAA